jgi:hypothetical protein
LTEQKQPDPEATGWIVLVVGFGILLLSLVGTPTVGTPRWVVAGAGITVMFGGLAAITQRQWSAKSEALALCAVAGLALMFSWVAFAPGSRPFSVETGVPGVSISSRGGEWLGRAAFGSFAIFLDVITIWGCWIVLRRKRR